MNFSLKSLDASVYIVILYELVLKELKMRDTDPISILDAYRDVAKGGGREILTT